MSLGEAAETKSCTPFDRIRRATFSSKESLSAWRQFIKKHTPETVEINIEAAGSSPLFDVRLKVVAGDGGKTEVSIVPGLPEIEKSLIRIVDDVVAAVKVSRAIPYLKGML